MQKVAALQPPPPFRLCQKKNNPKLFYIMWHYITAYFQRYKWIYFRLSYNNIMYKGFAKQPHADPPQRTQQIPRPPFQRCRAYIFLIAICLRHMLLSSLHYASVSVPFVPLFTTSLVSFRSSISISLSNAQQAQLHSLHSVHANPSFHFALTLATPTLNATQSPKYQGYISPPAIHSISFSRYPCFSRPEFQRYALRGCCPH